LHHFQGKDTTGLQCIHQKPTPYVANTPACPDATGVGGKIANEPCHVMGVKIIFHVSVRCKAGRDNSNKPLAHRKARRNNGKRKRQHAPSTDVYRFKIHVQRVQCKHNFKHPCALNAHPRKNKTAVSQRPNPDVSFDSGPSESDAAGPEVRPYYPGSSGMN